MSGKSPSWAQSWKECFLNSIFGIGVSSQKRESLSIKFVSVKLKPDFRVTRFDHFSRLLPSASRRRSLASEDMASSLFWSPGLLLMYSVMALSMKWIWVLNREQDSQKKRWSRTIIRSASDRWCSCPREIIELTSLQDIIERFMDSPFQLGHWASGDLCQLKSICGNQNR